MQQPFCRWSPFGLLPLLLWPNWASPLLPDHFEEAGAAGPFRSARQPGRSETAEIVDLAAYRQRRNDMDTAAGQRPQLLEG